MTSRYKSSIGFIKCMADENPYRLKIDKDFEMNFFEKPDRRLIKEFYNEFAKLQKQQNIAAGDWPSADDMISTMEDRWKVHERASSSKYPHAIDPFENGGFYMNLYAAFRFIYCVEKTLDEIEYDGLTFERTEALAQGCSFLVVNSSYVMMGVDDEFEWNRHYVLCDDVVTMAENMHRIARFYVSYGNRDDDSGVGTKDVLEVTRFDNIEYRLSCKYIREGLRVMKLFHILVVLKISPMYTEAVHMISDKLINALWDALYDKRIFKTTVNGDLGGWSKGFHKSTRIKIYFAIGNSDRYGIRLDFPHDDVNYIHLNLDQPGNVSETGFPFDEKRRQDILSVISTENFDKLFYEKDNLYWFKSGYKATVSRLYGKNTETSDYLLELIHDQGHIRIGEDSSESKKAVSEFSSAFAEALIDGGFLSNPYGDVIEDDGLVYQYYLFQDYIFDTVIKLRGLDIGRELGLDGKYHKARDHQEIDSQVRGIFDQYIKEKFPNDEKLKGFVCIRCELDEFFERCLDRLDELKN